MSLNGMVVGVEKQAREPLGGDGKRKKRVVVRSGGIDARTSLRMPSQASA